MTLNIDIQFGKVSEPTGKYVGWRVKHEVEGGRDTPPGMPEVTPPLSYKPVEMTRAIQLMSFELANKANSEVTAKRWTAVHDHDRAFTNFQGFAKPGDPRANFILGENLTSPLPKYDKAQRVCGGSFIRGVASYSVLQAFSVALNLAKEMVLNPTETLSAVGTMGVRGYLKTAKDFLLSNNVLSCVPGVHGIDANAPMPDNETIMKNNWFIYAVSTGVNDESIISHFPQGQGGAVLIPFIFSQTITFPLEFFEYWEKDVLPDPLKIGG